MEGAGPHGLEERAPEAGVEQPAAGATKETNRDICFWYMEAFFSGERFR